MLWVPIDHPSGAEPEEREECDDWSEPPTLVFPVIALFSWSGGKRSVDLFCDGVDIEIIGADVGELDATCLGVVFKAWENIWPYDAECLGRRAV